MYLVHVFVAFSDVSLADMLEADTPEVSAKNKPMPIVVCYSWEETTAAGVYDKLAYLYS